MFCYHFIISVYKKKDVEVADGSISKSININTGDVVNIVKLTTKVNSEAETSEVYSSLDNVIILYR